MGKVWANIDIYMAQKTIWLIFKYFFTNYTYMVHNINVGEIWVSHWSLQACN